MNSRKINHFPDHLEVNLASKPPSPLEFPGPLTPPPLRNFRFPPWWGSGYWVIPEKIHTPTTEGMIF